MSELERIQELSATSRYQECLQACQDSLKNNPKESFAFKYAGKSLFALGNLEQAKQCLFKAHQLDSLDPETLKDIGNIFNTNHDYKEAAKYYNQALKINPNYASAINNLGLIARQEGNLQLAKHLVEKARDLDPTFAPFHINLSTIQRDLGDLDQALTSTLKSLELNPKNPVALMNLGGIQKDLGNLDHALSSTLESLKLNPDNSDALMNLSGIYIELGHLDKALDVSREALKKGPGTDRASLVLAIRYHEMGLYEEGVRALSGVQSKEGKCLLLSLYLSLDRKTEFNRCAKELSDKGWYNQRSIAAIDHANVIYSQSHQNGLNGDTLDSIINQQIGKHEFPDTLLKEILLYLSETTIQPRYQTLLVNGVQTSGNILDTPKKSFKQLKDLIIKKLEEYNQECNINTDKNFKLHWENHMYTLRSWAIMLERGGNLQSHNHENGWLTGTFYLQMPERTDNSEEGAIEFSHQGPKYPPRESSFNRKVIKPEVRDLNIFSSSLFHRTLPFQSSTKRICIAFDLNRVEKMWTKAD